ncbi:Linear gramicidin synthase subunit D [Streptomyces alboniger]
MHTSEQDSALDTPIPQVLHAIWAEALGLEEIGFDDDFLQLGGHSLLAMRITAEAGEAFDIDLPMAVLFRHPTLAAFTAAVEAEIREQELVALSDEQRG